MSFSYNEMVSRNIGTISEVDQEILLASAVAIAGTGGIGGLLAERLTRLGVGRLILSDPGNFEISNLNRQHGCSVSTIGSNKAKEVANLCKAINPTADIQWDSRGLETQEDMERFIKDALVVADTMDYGLFKQNIYLQRSARRKGIPYLFSSSYGFGAIVMVFMPEGITLEQFNKINSEIDLDKMGKVTVSPESVIPVFPDYLWGTLTSNDLDEIIKGKRFVPVNSIGVGLNVIMIAFEIINVILKKRPIIAAPHFQHIDLFEKVFQIK